MPSARVGFSCIEIRVIRGELVVLGHARMSDEIGHLVPCSTVVTRAGSLRPCNNATRAAVPGPHLVDLIELNLPTPTTSPHLPSSDDGYGTIIAPHERRAPHTFNL